MKFTTLIPTTDNDGVPIRRSKLDRLVNNLWTPFQGMTDEGLVNGRWIGVDGQIFQDTCMKISIECERERLPDAIRAVRRLGRKLRQQAMYFEVNGYDGVQIMRIEAPGTSAGEKP